MKLFIDYYIKNKLHIKILCKFMQQFKCQNFSNLSSKIYVSALIQKDKIVNLNSFGFHLCKMNCKK